MRSVIYWISVIGTFGLCFWYPYQTSNTTKNLAPLSLTSYLDVEPSFVYYAENKFHARVIGSLRIDLDTNKMKSDFTAYNTLVINDFDYVLDSQYSLNWTVGENQTPGFDQQNRTTQSPRSTS